MRKIKKIVPSKNMLGTILLIMLLPPMWGMILSLFLFVKNKRQEYLYAFIATFSVFCTYYFFSVDNGLRFIQTYRDASAWLWYEGDPLTSLIYMGTKWLRLECSHFFYLNNVIIYLIWYLLLKNILPPTLSYRILCVIFLTAISIKSTVGLVYYTLSLLWGTYYFSSLKKHTLLHLAILIISVYLLHPGFFLILIPAIGLYYMLKKSDKLYFVYLIILFIVSGLIGHIKIGYTGVDVIDELLTAYDSYTGTENKWGLRMGFQEIQGYTYSIMFYVIPSFYAFIFYLSIKYRHDIINKQIVAIFQTAMIFYVNLLSFVTLTERTLVVLSITAMLTALQLYQIKQCFLRLSHIVCFSVLFFLFSFTKESTFCFPDKTLKNYNSLRKQIYYVPSIALLDYNNWGYSDEFLKHNLYIR